MYIGGGPGFQVLPALESLRTRFSRQQRSIGACVNVSAQQSPLKPQDPRLP